jgi:hypothetical protein
MKQEENSVIRNIVLSASITKFKWAFRLVEMNGKWPVGRLREEIG